MAFHTPALLLPPVLTESFANSYFNEAFKQFSSWIVTRAGNHLPPFIVALFITLLILLLQAITRWLAKRKSWGIWGAGRGEANSSKPRQGRDLKLENKATHSESLEARQSENLISVVLGDLCKQIFSFLMFYYEWRTSPFWPVTPKDNYPVWVKHSPYFDAD